MKVIPSVICVLFLSTFANAYPTESLETAGNKDQTATDGKKSDSIGSAKTTTVVEESKDKETHPESTITTEEQPKTDHVESKKKCADVVCGEIPNPSDAQCRASNEESTIHVFNPFIGKISDCCPLWFCLKADGSFYFHYGVNSLKDADLGEVKSSVSNKFAYSSSFGTVPHANQLPENLAYDFRQVFPAQNPGNQFGFAGQPGFPPMGPFPPLQQQFPNFQQQQKQPQFQEWQGQGFHERSNTFAQFQQPQQLGVPQQNNFGQNAPENFRRIPRGSHQFF